jgi:hypothetical protein
MVFSALLLSLFLAWVGACQARPHNPMNHGRVARHSARVRLRRTGKQHPARCPFAPQSEAAIAPDEDDDDSRMRIAQPAAGEGATLLTLSSVCPHSVPSLAPPRRMPAEPLYQTLGILLI